MSTIAVISATQGLRGEDIDMDQDLMSPQVDHSYSTPHQISEAVKEEAQKENQSNNVHEEKPDLIPLQTQCLSATTVVQNEHMAKVEPHEINVEKEVKNEDCEMENKDDIDNDVTTLSGMENTEVLGYIKKIPIDDVPYNVVHDDIAKALTMTNCDKVSVRIMRKVIPCIRIVSYLKNSEFVGKKKIKGLWAKRPFDWPSNIPYKDPNNGEKIDGKTVPKANSVELKEMFIFLKEKLMQKMEKHFKEINKEELEELRKKGASFSSSNHQYQFNASIGGKMSSTGLKKHQNIFHPYYNSQNSRHNAVDQLKNKELQDNVENQRSMKWANSTVQSIPTFVASEEYNEKNMQARPNSDGSLLNNDSYEIVYLPETSQNSDNSDISDGDVGYVQFYDHEEGTVQLLKLNPGVYEINDASLENGMENLKPLQEVTEAVQIENQMEESEDLRSVSTSNVDKSLYSNVVLVQASTPEVEAVKHLINGQPLKLHHEELPPTKGPIQQETYNNTSVPIVEKSVQEIVPKMEPQSPLPPLGTMSVSPSQIAYSISGSVLSNSPDQTYARNRLLQETHDRIKGKIVQLQSDSLGEVEIAIRLNRIYKGVVQLQFQKALIGHQNNFIKAASSCEQVIDKAILDGNNYNTTEFLKDLDCIIEQYNSNSEEQIQKTTVYQVSAPDHPPVLSTKQISGFPFNGLSPKSPGTALSERMDQLDLDALVSAKDDPMQLGIRVRGEDVRKLKSIIEPHNNQQNYGESDENLLLLPEKLRDHTMDINLSKQETEDDLYKDLEEILKNIDHEVDIKKQKMDDNEIDSFEVDIKKQKVSHNKMETSQRESQYEESKVPYSFQQIVGVSGSALNKSGDTVSQQNKFTLYDVKDSKPSPTFSMPSDVNVEENIINDVIGLQDSYQCYKVDWKSGASERTEEAKAPQQVSSPECAGLISGMYRMNARQDSQPAFIHGFSQCFGEGNTFSPPNVGNQNAHSSNPSLQFDYSNFSPSLVAGCDSDMGNGVIPEVVENFDFMIDKEEEIRPRGRKRCISDRDTTKKLR